MKRKVDMTSRMERWRSLMEKKMEEMTPRMEGWESLMEKAEEEEGRDDPKDGEMEESKGEG
jgi:hypothetical protein